MTPFPRFRARGRGVRRLPGEMNKLEAAFAEHLEMQRKAGEIAAWWYEPLKLRLATRTYWTPDFLVMLLGGLLHIYEVKGGLFEDDARVKTKVAAEQFAWLANVYVVRRQPKRDGGGWTIVAVTAAEKGQGE